MNGFVDAASFSNHRAAHFQTPLAITAKSPAQLDLAPFVAARRAPAKTRNLSRNRHHLPLQTGKNLTSTRYTPRDVAINSPAPCANNSAATRCPSPIAVATSDLPCASSRRFPSGL